MRKYSTKIIAFYKSEKFQQFWKDPVWSKVLATGIIAVISLICTAVLYSWESLHISQILETAINYLFKFVISFSTWLDKIILNKILSLFIKVFLVITTIFLLLYLVYRKTINYWRGLFLKKESDITEIPVLHNHPADLFDYKLGAAFPGIQKDSLTWFTNSKEAAHRLEVLLQKPIRYRIIAEDEFEGYQDIFWWYRGSSNMFVQSFRILSKSLCLLDEHTELNINKIAVYRSRRRRLSFIYVETKPMDATGFYDKSRIDDSIKKYGYYEEPYAILGKRNISIVDYEDGATIIKGKVVSANDAVSRLRYVSKYNFIIASQLSPYNDNYFDRYADEYFNGVLSDKCTYDDIWEFMRVCRDEKDTYTHREDPYRDMLG